MSDVYKLIMDSETYRLRAKFPDLERSFRIPEGKNAGDMLDGSHELDSRGTYYDYEMTVEPHPLYPEDYDRFFDAISHPSGRHTVLMPYGQTSIAIDVNVTSGRDTCRGIIDGTRHWSGLKVQFKARTPSRIPEVSA